VEKKAATPATKKPAVKAQKALRKKAAKALPKPVPRLPVGRSPLISVRRCEPKNDQRSLGPSRETGRGFLRHSWLTVSARHHF
jgi:hypothetical protein